MTDNQPQRLITDSVGLGGANKPDDVRAIEYVLNIVLGSKQFPEEGKCEQRLIDAIRNFQVKTLGSPTGDGRIDPDGRTLKGLVERAYQAQSTQASPSAASPTPHRAKVDNYLRATFAAAAAPGAPAKLTDSDFVAAAEALKPGVQVAMIRAFAEVESGGRSGFGPNGLPKIAFEGHIFRKHTNQAHDRTHPLLSYAYVKKAGPEWQTNNKDQDAAWQALNQAIALDHDAALKSCSWGMFQIMGFNYTKCGFDTVDAFVDKMKAGERGQLDAFVGFCKSVPGLRDALAAKNFVECARLYNGADYGDYDRRLSTAFKKYGGN